MQNQLGCFIYDTLDYKKMGHDDFEAWIDSEPQPNGTTYPTLVKFLVPHSEARNVFSRLELMNITGTSLLDREGMASDVKNSYNYNRKAGFPWDLKMGPPDNTKM